MEELRIKLEISTVLRAQRGCVGSGAKEVRSGSASLWANLLCAVEAMGVKDKVRTTTIMKI
jgi:hypothetical protein